MAETQKPENPTSASPPRSPVEGGPMPEVTPQDRPTSVATTVALVLVSVLIAVAILGTAAWLTANRLPHAKATDAAATRAAKPGDPPANALSDMKMPPGAQAVPGSFAGVKTDAPPMYTVPGRLPAVLAFFTKQAQRRGWSAHVRPSSSGDTQATIVLESGHQRRMITVRENAAQGVCTLAVHDL